MQTSIRLTSNKTLVDNGTHIGVPWATSNGNHDVFTMDHSFSSFPIDSFYSVFIDKTASSIQVCNVSVDI